MKNIDQANTDGNRRFEVPIQELLSLVKKSKNKKDRATFFFESGARDHLFRLEALCRIYKSVQGKKIFDPLGEEIKALEDQLGRIDHYHGFLKEFSVEPHIPGSFLRYFITNKEQEMTSLREMIDEGNIFSNESRLLEISNTLQKVKWYDRDLEKKAIAIFLAEQIDKLIVQYDNGVLHFNDIEKGVHEFRRRLRWISIYAQSLNGLIRIKKVGQIPEKLKKYLTLEILNSPFNILPPAQKGTEVLEIQAPPFYALSWMIQESGRLKDAGLKINAIAEGIRLSDIRTPKTAAILHAHLLPKNSPSKRRLMENMEGMADTFMNNDRVLYLIRRDLLRSLN